MDSRQLKDSNAVRSKSLLSLHGVQKSFGSNAVLKDIDFALNQGEIHALVGENGAGKSTCLSLLYGLHTPSSGDIRRDGETVRILGPSHAQDLGISCVFQELSLAGSLSIAENIFAGRAPSRFGVVDWKALRRRAEALLAEFDLALDVTAPVDSLPISTRQIVEIAKALSLDSKVLLLDEPTSALTPDEVEALFKVLRKLTARGIGIVYVSHHMSEIFAIADRISVLRDGHMISCNATQDTSQTQVVAEMIGSAHPGDVERSIDKLGDVVLAVNNLSQDGHFSDISFQVRKGEILGLAGLLGSRRSEIVRCIAGLTQSDTGSVTLNGQKIAFASLRAAMRAGVGFVPEERKTEGLFLDDPLSANLVSSSMEKHTSFGLLNAKSIRAASDSAIASFSVKTRGPEEKIGALSGGNQQKIMLAKWLERSPDLLIIEEPTKGVDVGAKFQIHTELMRRAAAGMAILVVSSDFPELVSLATNILVIHEGRISGSVAARDATDDLLLQMAAGLPSPTFDQTQSNAEL
ncbi:sugar ABC transporter ATP-binding protein [Pelagimonas varians]|uniref:Galactose/methyl galactoside import ATP-binding protein MglA n=1 Tax=Pelagimonas varians TaxID=696760 RepID=A0A238K982_9RHOB|nr:sugar ABC transporter ATP-binding protein [Pelagimonas varians]PYG31831.1 monosaccharide ABC transporter ATP-binding protein (CUT2 family) [Pelagimonas varians]SMX38526.1 Galactose/methyl galactoside import ATP-binding protein MglA [Pelagimonas varians]